MTEFDLVVRGGTVATATGVFDADVGIAGEQVAAIGRELAAGAVEIDASGRLVLPGGVDSHCHIEQLTASGLMNADTFATATTSAAIGGTTTVIPFAAQHVGTSLTEVVEDYHDAARRGAVVDYAFHMILCDPRPEVLAQELPPLARSGHGSLKVFLTYDRLRIEDGQFLDVLDAARTYGLMVCVHAENHGMIGWMGKRLLAGGYRAPRYHVPSHPRLGEIEAIGRAIACAALVDQPLMIFHVSTAEGAGVIHRARGEGHKVWGETCPGPTLDRARPRPAGLEVRWMSPPLREPSDQEALWWARDRHAADRVRPPRPYRMDEKASSPAAMTRASGDRQRHAGPRAAPAGAVRRHGQPRAARAREVRRADRDGAGEALRPAQGQHRGRRGCRPRRLGSRADGRDRPGATPRRRRLHTPPAARSRAGRSRSYDGARWS